MLQTFKNGQTSVVLRVKLLDSSKTDGSGLTGLTSASSGLIISTIADNEASATTYTVAGSTIEAVTTLGTFAAPTATKCRFKEVDSTNHKGVYELQIADARFAVSSAKSLLVSISGATNLAQTDFVVQLQTDDPYVAKISSGTGAGQISLSSGAVTVGTNNNKTGYTASTVSDKTGYSLSQTFPTNFASMSIDGSGRVDVAKIAGTSQTARDIGASVLLSAGTGTGQLDFTSGVVKSNLAQILGTALTETAGQIAAAFKKFFNIATPASTMDALTLVATATNLTNAPTSGDFTSAMKTSLNAATPAVTVSDKTGFSLASGGLSAVTSWSVAITGNITGNLSGSVGSVTGLTASDVGAIKTTLGTAGAGLTALGDTRIAHLDADVSSRLASSGYTAPDNSSITAIKAKTDNLPASPAAIGSAMTLTVAYDAAKTAAQAGDAMNLVGAYDAAKGAAQVSDIPSAGTIASTVWDEALSGHATSGSAGAELTSAGSGGGPSASDIAAAVWDQTTPGHTTAGTFGGMTSDISADVGTTIPTAIAALPSATSIRSEIDSNSTQLAAIKSKTDNIPASPAATGAAMTLTSAYDAAKTAASATTAAAIKAKTDSLPSSPAATSDIPTAAAIRTEMDSNSTKLAHLDADISSRSTFAGGTVASVTGNVGGNVVGSVGSVTAQVNANIAAVNGVTVEGDGSTGHPWGPA